MKANRTVYTANHPDLAAEFVTPLAGDLGDDSCPRGRLPGPRHATVG
jgi:hypothetical protein